MSDIPTPIVLLAAGNSSRLGQPKQLLQLGETSLLERAFYTAIAVSPGNVLVVLGASSALIKERLSLPEESTLVNENWREGIASSIRTAMSTIRLREEITRVILMVCDQPYLSSRHLQRLIDTAANTQSGIIASSYQQVTGTPVLFKRQYFDDLCTLQGDHGAKQLMVQFAPDVTVVPFKNGEIDIDTAPDYEKLLKNDHRPV